MGDPIQQLSDITGLSIEDIDNIAAILDMDTKDTPRLRMCCLVYRWLRSGGLDTGTCTRSIKYLSSKLCVVAEKAQSAIDSDRLGQDHEEYLKSCVAVMDNKWLSMGGQSEMLELDTGKIHPMTAELHVAVSMLFSGAAYLRTFSATPRQHSQEKETPPAS